MAFSNPAPPTSVREDEESKLTNADFRSLLMTPRDPSVAGSETPSIRKSSGGLKDFDEADDAYAKRRKKKMMYAKLKKQEEEREKELKAKYRDRCQERRDGKTTEYSDGQDLAKTAQYKAVAPTADQVSFAAEGRKLAIQESKFLGGDMEHTHLVKGLDYALLQKVKSEIASRESESLADSAGDAATGAS